MKSRCIRAALLSTVSVAFFCVPVAALQTSASQKSSSRAGDLLVVGDNDRVRVVRRREGQVRAVFDPVERSLVVLLDQSVAGARPDGRVDRAYRFFALGGDWPLGDRWEGVATIEEYSIAGEDAHQGVGMTTPSGLVQLLPKSAEAEFRNQAAGAVLGYGSVRRALAVGLPMDIAERQQLAQGFSSRPSAAEPPASGGYPAPSQPVRVGGNIKTPLKLQDVRPVYPQEALAARVTGQVILEATIGTDGQVTDAKVLRSIPLLDDAAVSAVKQWRFEPTLLNGVPVPVIMTVTVSFNLQ